MTRNQLDQETSPYLLQHKDNSVHWCVWSEDVLAKAKDEDKPILLSVGYAACHWCHVMAHESFENPEIAALMNENFINVKVDREERPDLDAIYQQALAVMGEQGGWPLTMFLTPEGEPYWGGTYFPPSPRYGRPGFPQILLQMKQVYDTQKDGIHKNIAQIKGALEKLSTPTAGTEISDEATEAVARKLVREIDPFTGGIGAAPKFPQPSLLAFLWDSYLRTGLEPYKKAVTLSLDHMCEGGIYDHLGGGFARYSTDDEWLVPHFEKMLYDNAQMIELMVAVSRETKSELYRQRIEETIGWVLREMRTPIGTFASAYDADSEGEEGRFYIWTKEQIEQTLSGLPDEYAHKFCQIYDITPYGNWEGTTILNRRRAHGPFDSETEAILKLCRERLWSVREEREKPSWDDKSLVDWNGMMVAALAQAAGQFNRSDWLSVATEAYQAIREHFVTESGLKHCWRLGQAKHAATLEDYSALCHAALCLYEQNGEMFHVKQCEEMVEILDREFWDASSGGYFTASSQTTDLIHRAKSAMDNVVPSGNGQMVGVLARLWMVTGNESYREKADSLVKCFAGDVQQRQIPLAQLLMGNQILRNARQVVIVGDGDEAQKMFHVKQTVSGANRFLIRLADTGDLPESHPASGKQVEPGKAAAFLCDSRGCSLPITSAEALKQALESR